MVKKITIIGGGIIGMSVAVELALRGANVQVIERNKIGEGCSYGNAGWLTPCFALPLPMPGMLLKSIKWLLNPDSPLYIKPSPSMDLMAWLIRFMKSMNQKQATESTRALVRLSQKSLELYKKLALEFPEEFDYQEKGLLMVAETDASMKSLRDELRYVGQFGVRGFELSSREVQEKEPVLKTTFKGGIFFPDEAQVDPFPLMQTLKKKALQLGVEIFENSEVINFEKGNNEVQKRLSKIRIRSLKSIEYSSERDLEVDTLILATGSWSKSVGKNLDINIPILGGKGYSMILPSLEPSIAQPIMVFDRKLAITPHKDRLRIAGTLELVDQDFQQTQRRVENILKGAKQCLPIDEKFTLQDAQDVWTGLRPCTPDGVPMIGKSSRYTNLFLACGHQMLGLQSGMGTGYLLADLIEGKTSLEDAKVFSPDRF